MVDSMNGTVIGKNEAITKVVKAIQRNRAGLKDPINLDTANFSMYSLISILISASSLSNKYFAKTLHNCVY
jgi:hypothetical protein